jgi:hypothetical protein
MRAHRLDPERIGAIIEGAIWDRRHGKHETSVEVLRTFRGRMGRRVLVRGLKTGRQWVVNPETLLCSYTPRITKIEPATKVGQPRRRPQKR